ncbi:hypothetical protein [Tsukamurella pulmonis]|nr:hypothetical protein [Tsukamurella pulmonis]
MRTCIGGYSNELGLDVLLGLFRDGDLVANVQITRAEGVVQLLGKYNRGFAATKDLGADLGRMVLADLQALGVPAAKHGWGLRDLQERAA